MAGERSAGTPDADEICRQVAEVFRGLVDKNSQEANDDALRRVKEAVRFCFQNQARSVEMAYRYDELMRFSNHCRTNPLSPNIVGMWQGLVHLSEAVHAEEQAITQGSATERADAPAAEQANFEDPSEEDIIARLMALLMAKEVTSYVQQPAADRSQAQIFTEFVQEHEAAAAQDRGEDAACPPILRQPRGTYTVAELREYANCVKKRRSVRDGEDRRIVGDMRIFDLQSNSVTYAINTVYTYCAGDKCPQEMVESRRQLDVFGDDYCALAKGKPTDDLWTRLLLISAVVVDEEASMKAKPGWVESWLAPRKTAKPQERSRLAQ